MSFYPSPEELAPAIEQYMMDRYDLPAEDVKVTSVDYRFGPGMDDITVNVSVRLPPKLVGPITITCTKGPDGAVP
jgi:hypothetical protein